MSLFNIINNIILIYYLNQKITFFQYLINHFKDGIESNKIENKIINHNYINHCLNPIFNKTINDYNKTFKFDKHINKKFEAFCFDDYQ